MDSKTKSPELIFVAGFPRSGTTWFANIFNSHRNVIYRHELIGRNYHKFGDELFKKIKGDGGLTDDQFAQAMKVICSANIDTDKPPFFEKGLSYSKSPQFHHTCWMIAKFFPPFRPLYNHLFKIPIDRSDLNILIKETRSTVDMSSMFTSLRVKNKLLLIRKPHGSIASHLSGIKKGKMNPPGNRYKSQWFSTFEDLDYIKALDLNDEKIASMSDTEFYAINWRLYHLEMLKIKSEHPDSILCFYEDFVENPIEEVKSLFKKIGLAFSVDVEQFIKESSGEASSSSEIKGEGGEYYGVFRTASFDQDAWKSILDDKQKEVINLHTSDIYEQLLKLK
uniref:sulfotransferase domain-containing protein n=1 Tax=Ningiella ruwaisensis TaxID=2364274 RepID=UPI00109FA547|nr:sulfotransferase domain-containing protein [Ningiella ruwaisensis]